MRRLTRRNARLLASVGIGVTGTLSECHLSFGQQNPNDQVVFHTASNDSNGTVTSFNNATGGTNANWNASVGTYSSTPYTNITTLAAGATPTAGYAYVVTGSSTGTGEMRTPTAGSSVSFAGDSLTIIPYNGQQNLYSTSTSGANQVDQTAGLFIKSAANTVITVNDLVLANGGALINFNNLAETFNGNIYLVPASTGTLDGISLMPTATAGQGIIDTRTNAGPLTVNANISGGGLLHILQSGGTTSGSVILTGNNTYTGGTLIDNTVPYGSTTSNGSASYPLVDINSPTALGTGTLSFLSVGGGPTIDTTVAGGETLTANNPMAWNGNFHFGGSNSLNLGSGAITLGANVTIATASSTLTAMGNISSPGGTYGITKTGAGILVLGGQLSYTGTTNVSSGTLELVSTGSTFPGGINVSSGATLALAVGGPGEFTAADFGNLLSTANFASGALLGIDTTAGSLSYGSNLIGSFGLNKLGSNTLTLTGTVNYTGPTTVTAGSLQLSRNTTLSPSSTVTVDPGAYLDVNGNSVTIGNLAGTSSNGVFPTITNNGPTPGVLTVGGGGYAGIISDGSSTMGLTVNTAGVFNLSGYNSYSGPTNLAGGTLLIGSASGLSFNSTISFTGGTLAFSSAYTGDPSGQFSTAPGQLYSFNTGGQAISLSGNLDSVGASLTTTGAGSLTLGGTNTYSGPTTVKGGTLIAPSAGAFQGTSGITVYNGASFSFTDSSGYAGLAGAAAGGAPITATVTGAGVGGAGAFSGSGTWAGNIAVTASGAAPTVVTATAGSTLNVGTVGGTGGAITGTGPVGFAATAGSTTVLNGVDTYTGETQILTPPGQSSSLILGSATAIPHAGPVNFATTGSGTLDLNGTSPTIGYLNGSSNSGLITNNGPVKSTLTIQASGTGSYSGAINDGTSPIAVHYTGTGNQTFGGTSGYSGGTNISSGTLTAASFYALGSGPVTLSGGTLGLSVSVPTGVTQTSINGLALGTAPTQFTVNNYNNSAVTPPFPATNTIAGGVLTLTDESNPENGQATSAFTNTPVSLGGNNGFVSTFTYNASGRSGHYTADGMTFCVQNDGPNSLGSTGGALGYAGGTLNNSSAALEFNIYAYESNVGTAFVTDGAVPASFTSVDSPELGAEPVNVTITYNASAQTLTENLVGVSSGGTYSQTITGVNLSSIVGGNSAYIGFTGSEGYDDSDQAISNFTYTTLAGAAAPVGASSIGNNVYAAPGTTSTIQLAIDHGANVGGIGNLNVATGATVKLSSVSGDGISTIGVLTVTGLTNAGIIDIGANTDLDVQNAGTAGLASITAMVAKGYNLTGGGNWQGSTGITSSAAASNSNHLTAVGVILNNSPTGQIYGAGTLFDGSSPGLNDVLVKYTYFGDANLDGKVDGSDYSLIDAGYASHGSLTGWYYGDFNYDGVIDGSDYALIDNAFNNQNTPLQTDALIASETDIVAATAVPEPVSLGAICLTTLGLLVPRRRRN